jgi:hypothetical protein
MTGWEYLEFNIDYSQEEPRLSIVHGPTYREAPVDTGGYEGDVAVRHLDVLGAEGWELVAMRGSGNFMSCTLKRPKE